MYKNVLLITLSKRNVKLRLQHFYLRFNICHILVNLWGHMCLYSVLFVKIFSILYLIVKISIYVNLIWKNS